MTGMRKVCELLIPKTGSEAINAVDSNGRTALHFATKTGMRKVCELLIPKMTLEAINAVNKDGRTALHTAYVKGMREVCELRVKIDPESVSARLDSALNRAMEIIKCELLISPQMS